MFSKFLIGTGIILVGLYLALRMILPKTGEASDSRKAVIFTILIGFLIFFLQGFVENKHSKSLPAFVVDYFGKFFGVEDGNGQTQLDESEEEELPENTQIENQLLPPINTENEGSDENSNPSSDDDLVASSLDSSEEKIIHSAAFSINLCPFEFRDYVKNTKPDYSVQVEIRPSSIEYIAIPPEYETYSEYTIFRTQECGRTETEKFTETILVQPSSTEFVTVPPVWENVDDIAVLRDGTRYSYTRNVLKEPARVLEKVIPGVTKQHIHERAPHLDPNCDGNSVITSSLPETKRRVKTPAQYVEKVVPAVYKNIGYDDWSYDKIKVYRVCDWDDNPKLREEVIKEMSKIGYRPRSSSDSAFGYQVGRFQRDNSLFKSGYITDKTLDALGIDYTASYRN